MNLVVDKTWRYTFVGRVDDVFEKKPVLRVDKGANWVHDKNDVVTVYGPGRWFLRFGTMSLDVGEEKPLASAGDNVRITIEKVYEQIR